MATKRNGDPMLHLRSEKIYMHSHSQMNRVYNHTHTHTYTHTFIYKGHYWDK